MAVVLGTNAGFVTSAPSGDPAGSNGTADYMAWVCGDTSPATAVRITEIGWYCDNATEAANFEVGLYADDSGDPDTLIYSDRTHAKGTDAGWKRVTGLDWEIDPNTKYWIAFQCDNTTTTTSTNTASSGGGGYALDYSQATLPATFGQNFLDANGIAAIYAVWDEGAQAGGTGQYINIDDTWRQLSEMWVNINDTWRKITELWVNIDDTWRRCYTT